MVFGNLTFAMKIQFDMSSGPLNETVKIFSGQIIRHETLVPSFQ